MEILALKDIADTRQIAARSQISGTYTCSRCKVSYSLIVAPPESLDDIGDPPPPHFDRLYAAIEAEHEDGHPTDLLVCRDDGVVGHGFIKRLYP